MAGNTTYVTLGRHCNPRGGEGRGGKGGPGGKGRGGKNSAACAMVCLRQTEYLETARTADIKQTQRGSTQS